MELSLFIYIASVLDSIACAIIVLLVTGAGLLTLGNMIVLSEYDYASKDATRVRQKSMVMLKIGVGLLAFGTLLPSKDTMYLMAGAYAGQQVAEMEQVPEILTKTLAVINKELDTALAE